MATILLTGATGSVSGSVFPYLNGKGHRLIGLVRNKAKAAALEAQGVELRLGDLTDLRTVERAFEGVDFAFLLAAPGPLGPIQYSNALWAARQGGVKHVVRMSAAGAAHDAPTLNSRMHALSDSEIAASGMTYTIVKPHIFMQNLFMNADGVTSQGALYLPLGDAKQPMIDARDIGATVAAILTNPAPHAGRVYTLTGPAAIGGAEAAAAIGEAIGKPVKYVPIPVPAMVESVAKAGLDDYMQVMLRDYFNAYSRGWIAQVTSSVKDITGNQPRGIAEFARDFARAFGGR